MTQIPDPAALLSDEDRKDKAKVKAARKSAKGWKLPTTKKGRQDEQVERIEQWLVENEEVPGW